MRSIYKNLLLAVSFTLFLTASLYAQDSNILYAVSTIEEKLRNTDFEIFRFKDLRFKGDIGKRVILRYQDGNDLQIKWRRALPGGHEFNNAPRFEMAAYELQKLILDESEYVVPPTVCRGFMFDEYKNIEAEAIPTFRKPNLVIVMMQYWLNEVTIGGEVYDKEKFEVNPTYAKHFANTNIMTNIINHKDSNEGNLLTSTDEDNPRVFTVDNGVTFSSPESDRGAIWKYIRVKKLPRKTIDRLKQITTKDLNEKLGVVAQFEFTEDKIFSVSPSKNLNPRKGVRKSGNTIQFGLTSYEIKAVKKKIDYILKQNKKGKYELF